MTMPPAQPVLNRDAAILLLEQSHMRCTDAEDDNVSFFWGFDPIPEMCLPFCYRVEAPGGEEPPVFENIVFSASFMLGHMSAWSKREEYNMAWPNPEDFAALIRDHILLRAALGLDRHGFFDQHLILRHQIEIALGGNFVPMRALQPVIAKYGRNHAMVTAVAYDLWRLGDYGASKNHLASQIGFVPFAPPMELGPHENGRDLRFSDLVPTRFR